MSVQFALVSYINSFSVFFLVSDFYGTDGLSGFSYLLLSDHIQGCVRMESFTKHFIAPILCSCIFGVICSCFLSIISMITEFILYTSV